MQALLKNISTILRDVVAKRGSEIEDTRREKYIDALMPKLRGNLGHAL